MFVSLRALTLAALLLACMTCTACSRSKDAYDGAGGTADRPSTSPLWAFAPPTATLGFVVADHTLGRYVGVIQTIIGILDAAPVSASLSAELSASLMETFKFDVLSTAGWKERGLDPARGFALFADASMEATVVILPVKDRAAFRKAFGGKKKKVAKLEVDEYEWGIVCAMQRKRYLCAESVERIVELSDEHPSAVRAQIELLPPDTRGDIELYVNVGEMPQVAEAVASVGTLEAIVLSSRLEADRITVRGWIPGQLRPDVLELVRGHAPSAEFQQTGEQATTVIRGRLPAQWLEQYFLFFSPKFALGTLGGDFQIVTSGGGAVAGALMFTLKDPMAGAQVLGLACATAEELEAEGEISGEIVGTECEIRVDLATKLGVNGLPPLVLRIAASNDVLTVRVGSPNLPELVGSVVDDTATSDLKKLLTEPQTVAMWTRHPDVDIVQAFRLVGDDVPQAIAETSAVLRWLLAHVYQAGLGVAVAEDGIRIQGQVITFAGDPPAAQAAYYDLMKQRLLAGAEKDYIAGRAALAKGHPDTRVAERVKLEDAGVPSVGLAGLMGSAVSFFWLMNASDEPVDAEPIHETGPEGPPLPAPPASPP